jgi:hypothetical protein
LIGCLAANRPIFLHLEKTATFAEYLEHMQAAYAVSQDFQKVVGADTAWRHHLNRIVANLGISPHEWEASDVPPSDWQSLPVNHELALMLEDGPNTIRGVVSYAASLFLPSTILRFCSEFERLATAVSRDPTQRLTELIPELTTYHSMGDA